MEKYLLILEVSKKQDYIFGSLELRENADRSADINFATCTELFKMVAPELYDEADNLVYTGGGHSVLQFENQDIAKEFATRVTTFALKTYSGLEVFSKIVEYNEKKSPGENLKFLTAELEKKKSLRNHSFYRVTYGIEKENVNNNNLSSIRNIYKDIVPAPEGWEYPTKFEKLIYNPLEGDLLKDNFIAVVHIDGNAMGARVNKIYEQNITDWKTTSASIKKFSEGIQDDFSNAFTELIAEIVEKTEPTGSLPIRPIIIAGDDVCFVTAGSIGIECARIFLEKLSLKKNPEDKKPYAACAGIAIVHRKYPFHKAYELAEALCSNAKKYGTSKDGNGQLSVMDWHIEFGQLKNNLEEIRKDYICEDGNRVELRPYIVVDPGEMNISEYKQYDFFRALCRGLQDKKSAIARSKVKEWRTALKQGEIESRYFLHSKEIKDILYHIFEARYRNEEEKIQQYLNILQGDVVIENEPFAEIDGIKRSLYFDAIELMDHVAFL